VKIRRKYLFFLSIAMLLLILIFSTAALCNGCGLDFSSKNNANNAQETIQQSSENTSAVITISEKERLIAEEDKAKALEAEKKAAEENIISSGSDAVNDTSASSTAGASTADESLAASSGTAPSIRLAVYEGPVYSAADSVYYYRVKADVSGSSPIEVSFSRDDSHGAWGAKKAQINLSAGQSYTLAASASNTIGFSSASVTLTAPGSSSGASTSSGSNTAPTAGEISLSSSTIITNTTYNASVSASDAEGDTLSYNWSATSGLITNPNVNPVQYRTPGTPGSVTISVVISDSHGATITKTKTFTVSHPTAGIDSPGSGIVTPVTINMPVVNAEGGYIEQSGYINYGGCLFAGDSNNNRGCQGYISYDISGLSGATINSANMTFNIQSVYGSGGLGSLCAGTLNWGTNPISSSLYGIGYIIGLGGYTTPSFTISGDALKNALQNSITAHQPRFQVVIWFSGGGSDGNGAWDGWEYRQSDITLTVSYVPSI